MKKSHLSLMKNGWFIGDFSPSVLRTKNFEVGFRYHNKNEKIEKHRHNQLVEYNLLVSGKMEINGEVMEAGDIFILEKGEIVDAKVISESAGIICVKTPSIPSDKEIIST